MPADPELVEAFKQAIAAAVTPLQNELAALKAQNETLSKTANHLAGQQRQQLESAAPAAAVSAKGKTPDESRRELAMYAARQLYTQKGGKPGKEAEAFFRYLELDHKITSRNGNVFAQPVDETGSETGDGKPLDELMEEVRTTPIFSGFFNAPKSTTGAARSMSSASAQTENTMRNADGTANWDAAVKAIK